MGFIIAGILLAAFISFIAVRSKEDRVSLLSNLCGLALVGGIVAGLLANTGGYKPAYEIETIKLQDMTDQITSTGKGSLFYVSINASNDYKFYTQIESEFAGKNSKAYVSKTISGDNITVVEEDNCQIPRLIKYCQDSNITFWSFGLGCNKYSYVFYVPKGTIAHEFALGQ